MRKMTRTLLFLLACRFVSALHAENLSKPLALTTPRTHGPQVQLLQERLLDLGFTEVGKPDGYLGPMTEAAWKSYQRFVGASPTGLVEPRLWDVLFSSNADLKAVHEAVILANRSLHAKVKTIEKDLSGRSTEGGTLTVASEGRVVRSLKAQLFGEMGQVQYVVPVITGGFAVLETTFSYPAPFDVEHADLSGAAYYALPTQTLRVVDGKVEVFALGQVPLRDLLLHELKNAVPGGQ